MSGAGSFLKADWDGNITSLQRETLLLLTQGLTSKEMAKHWGVSPAAIDGRIAKLIRKAGCNNRKALIRWYIQHSGLPPSDETQLGIDPGPTPISTSERTSADLVEQNEAASVSQRVAVDAVPLPETQFRREHVRARIEWLGHEVTWLQLILVLALLTGLSLIGH